MGKTSGKKTPTTSFDEFIQTSELPVLVDFWAEWCGPCKMMEPAIKEAAKKLSGRVKVIKVNVDQKAQIAARYQIRSIPTMILFKQGQPVWRTTGAQSTNNILRQVEPQL